MPGKNKALYILIVLIVILGGVYYFWSSRVKKNDQNVVTVGYLPIYVDLPLFVAKEKGFFEQRGVNVKLDRKESSPDIGAALANDSYDAGASVATAVALSTESRDPGKVKIFVVDAENQENYLSSFVVRKDSGITELTSLKGKTIGGFPGPQATVFGKMVLEKFGLNPQTDVNWIEIASSSQLDALNEKKVDALFTYEPTATQAVLERNNVKLMPGAVERNIINPWQAGVWLLNDKFLASKPELAKQFVLAIYDAIDYIRQNPQEAKRALIPYAQGITQEVAQAAPNIPFTKLQEVDIDTLQKQADIFTERKTISKNIDIRQMLLPKDFVASK